MFVCKDFDGRFGECLWNKPCKLISKFELSSKDDNTDAKEQTPAMCPMRHLKDNLDKNIDWKIRLV